MPPSFFSLTRPATFSSSADFDTPYGSSLTTTAGRVPPRAFESSSTWARARTGTEPRPVAYILRAPERPRMMPPPGKSGPGTSSKSASSERAGSAMSAWTASTNSPRLCGGIDVAIPTAMPCAPLRRRKGSLAGSTVGSRSEPSKLSAKSTVSIATSASSASFARLASRHSVYRIAAGGSGSIEPKLPWPSTSGARSEKSCAIRTSASYTEPSPCGWYLPSTSPTTRAHLRCGVVGCRLSWSIP